MPQRKAIELSDSESIFDWEGKVLEAMIPQLQSCTRISSTLGLFKFEDRYYLITKWWKSVPWLEDWFILDLKEEWSYSLEENLFDKQIFYKIKLPSWKFALVSEKGDFFGSKEWFENIWKQFVYVDGKHYILVTLWNNAKCLISKSWDIFWWFINNIWQLTYNFKKNGITFIWFLFMVMDNSILDWVHYEDIIGKSFNWIWEMRWCHIWEVKMKWKEYVVVQDRWTEVSKPKWKIVDKKTWEDYYSYQEEYDDFIWKFVIDWQEYLLVEFSWELFLLQDNTVVRWLFVHYDEKTCILEITNSADIQQHRAIDTLKWEILDRPESTQDSLIAALKW